MDRKWQIFEHQSFDYLVATYGSQVNFTKYGESDSTQADVFIETSNTSFFIEIKSSKAQSGQFVLIPDVENETFVFSENNKTKSNEYVDAIVNYMNSNFYEYEKAGTKGKKLDMESNIFSDWIKNYYQSKNVKYILTKSSTSYIFVPLNKLDTYFDITATFRVKRSGSSKPPKNIHNKLISFIQNMYPNSASEEDKKNLYLIMDNKSLHGTKFIFEDNNYQLSKDDDTGNYKIRKLSNTANPNVIFSIKLKKEQDDSDLSEFENDLIK